MTQTVTRQKIEIPVPDASSLTLVLRTGPCRVRLTPSDATAWISGTYDDPTGALPLQISVGPTTTIAQGFSPEAIGAAALPTLELGFSVARPFSLELNAGASENVFDLGGLPLSALVVKTGAGKFDIDFSRPNPSAMSHIELGTGAGSLSAKNLANANFESMRFGGGVAACTLDFGGALLRDARVRIDAGLGSVDLLIPATTAARVNTKAFAASRQVTGAFTQQGDTYATQPAVQGVRPILDIDVSVAFGALKLLAT